MREDSAVGLTHNHRALHVANGQCLSAMLFCLAQGRYGVSRLSRLGNHQQQRVLVEYWIAIAELRGVVYVHRHARELLDHIFTGEAGVPGRSAGSDFYCRETFEIGFSDVLNLVEKYFAGIQREPSLHSVADGARLLVNLLEHKMLEAALLSHYRIPGNSLNRRLDRIALEISYAHRVFREHGDFTVAEKKDVARMLQDGRNIRGDKKLAISEADDDGWSLTHGNNGVRLVGVDY